MGDVIGDSVIFWGLIVGGGLFGRGGLEGG